MKNGVRLLVTLLGIVVILATIPVISASAAIVQEFPLMTDKNVLVANENTALITTFEQDPVSKMITATVQLEQGGTEGIETSVLGIAIYFNGNRVAPYSFNDKTSEPASFTNGRIDYETYKDNLSKVFGAYYKKNTASGFTFESNQLIQNEPQSTTSSDSFINIMLNYTNSENELEERKINAGEKFDVATFYFMPVNEDDSSLDLDMFKFKFSRDYWSFIRATNFLGVDTHLLEASSLGLDLDMYTVAVKPRSFRIHMHQLPPAVEADNSGRQINGYDTATMQWSYDGDVYNDGVPAVKKESHEIHVRVKGDLRYGGNDGLYTEYKKYLDSEATIVEFEAVQSNSPIVKTVTEGDKEITGKGEPGSDITVTFPDGSTGETTVNGGGNWTVKVPDGVTLEPGDKIEVVQEEKGLKPSDPVIKFVTEKAAPDKSGEPDVNPVTEGDKEITGKGEPGSDIIVTFQDGETEIAVVDEDGNWTVEVPDEVTLEPGDEINVVQIEDGKDPSKPVTVIVAEKDKDDDDENPEKSGKPEVDPVTEGDKEITGKGEPGSEIIVTFPGGVTEETTVDEDCNWLVEVPDDVTLEPGDKIEVVQIEEDKDPSEPVIVVVEEKKDVDNEPERSDPPTVNPVTEGDDEITGTGEPGSEITVTFPDGETETVIVDKDGNWNLVIPDDVELKSGDRIEVVQIEDGKRPSKPVVIIVGSKPPDQTTKVTRSPEVINEIEIPLSYLEKGEHRTYIVGYTDKTVRADKSITRAEVAMIFYRLLQNNYQGGNAGLNFKDVPNGAWFSQAVRTLAQLGIIQGYGDGTFRPNDPITRAEFAVIAARFDELEYVSGIAFTDVALSHWAVDSIQSAYAKGWVNGYDGGEFRPEQNITRAEVTKIIDTMLKRLPAELPENLINPYNDISNTHGAYINIMEASTDHIYSRNDDGTEFWMAHICPITGRELIHVLDSELLK